MGIRAWLAALLLVPACVLAQSADPASDAPEQRNRGLFTPAASYAEALRAWRNAEDVNAWIGAKFEYDLSRAMRLSETQRGNGGALPIHAPEAFFADPAGVCLDLSRFAVETLLAIEAQSRPAYLMIEFAPLSIAGNTLRLHWMATFQREGGHYFFADSKRPGLIAGPYASVADFMAEYARYRGREIVRWRQTASYQRQMRTMAAKQPRPDPERDKR